MTTAKKRNIVLQIFAVLVLTVLTVSIVAACTKDKNDGAKNYTYREVTEQFPTDWNPFTWSTGADDTLLINITQPFYEREEVLDSQGKVQYGDDGIVKTKIVNMMASDVPEDYGTELAKRTDGKNYGFTLDGTGALTATQKYRAWRIPVRNDIRWNNGDLVTIEDFRYSYEKLLSPEFKNKRADMWIEGNNAILGANKYYDGTGSFEDVGLEFIDGKQDGDPDGTMGSVLYVFANQTSPYFEEIYSKWTNLLVHKQTFEKGIYQQGNLKMSHYNEDVSNTMSYGAYKLVAKTDKSYTLERNTQFGLEKDSQFRFGDQYQATRIEITASSDANTTRNEFLAGKYDYAPLASTDKDLAGSKRRFDVTSEYSMRLYFNYDRDALKSIETTSANHPTNVYQPKNLQYLANVNFRKAFSLAMNRNELKAEYSPSATSSSFLFNEMYFNSTAPFEQYRFTEDALKVLFDREGVDTTGWTIDKMKDEYSNLNGFKLDEAKELFKQARKEELASVGETDNGQTVNVKFTILGAKNALTAQTPMINKLKENIKTATEGTNLSVEVGFVSSEGSERYTLVDNGNAEAQLGALGGATTNITNLLSTYLGLGIGDGYENGETYGFKPQDIMQTIDMTKMLNTGDADVTSAVKKLLETNPSTTNNPNDLTLALNQWGVLFGSTKKAIENDNIDYSFLPGATENGKPNEANRGNELIGTAVNVNWYRHVIPYLEAAVLDQYAQVPLVIDTKAIMYSLRYDPLITGRYDPVMGRGSFKLTKFKQTDAEWDNFCKNNNLESLYKA